MYIVLQVSLAAVVLTGFAACGGGGSSPRPEDPVGSDSDVIFQNSSDDLGLSHVVEAEDDLDGDGWKDFVSVQYQQVEIFMNDRIGQFVESTESTNIIHTRTTFSTAGGDYNGDGSVDLFFDHWGDRWDLSQPLTEYLWQNDGAGHFQDVSAMI